MNNLNIIKKELYNDEFLQDFFNIKKDEIKNITPKKIAKIINMDCSICLCYGCRLFTRNCASGVYPFKKSECYAFIESYFSRDFNPDTDLCQCEACKQNRGEDLDYHYWILYYNDNQREIYERSLPEAKSYAINQGFFNVEDYPYINGIRIDKKGENNENNND